MGWTSYHAQHYNRNGSVNRKAECDDYFLGGLNKGCYEVLKSTVVGSVYYAAVRRLKRYVGKDENGNGIYEDVTNEPVWAAVFLTRVDSRDYFNFAYKDMSEDVEPFYYDCPLSILKLLSSTTDESALKWRQKCKERSEQKKSPTALANLPIGAQIQIKRGDTVKTFVKHAPAYQFKRPFWYNAARGTYIPTKRIPPDYIVLDATN